jgi:AcrR family transcriptional regulator
MATQAARSEATRQALITAGRALFAERGFAGAPTEEILERAGVSRGAMYHHFKGKDELFLAVFEAVEVDLTARVIERSITGATPLDQLRLGFDAFLSLCLDPEVQRIVLLDGPTVLGWETWHEIDERYAYGLIKAALDGAIAVGQIAEGSSEAMAHALLGAMMQAGFVVAKAADQAAARTQMAEMFDRLISGL